MPIGNNAPKLIEKTTGKTRKAKVTSITRKTGEASKATKERKTQYTAKMTFYLKPDLLDKLYNFAYWDRYSLTEAFNIILEDGLKGKTTKPVPKDRR